jgi:uncharacterized protein YprB with RNaseH-like and TPR domain
VTSVLRRTFQILSGVGEKTEQKLWRRGVTSWADLREAGDDELPGRVTRRRDTHEDQLAMAEEHLAANHTAPFARWMANDAQWRMLEEVSEHVMYLDIETTGLSYPDGRATVVGAHTEAEGTRSLVRGQDLSAGAVEALVDEAACLVTFNGRRFDGPWLEREFGLSIDVPHVDLMYAFRRLGLSGGLKSIEQQLGLERPDDVDDVGGYEAVKLWRRWERGDHDALDQLLTYNREDVVNMKPLAEIAYERLRSEVYEPHQPQAEPEAEAEQAELAVEETR